MGRPSGAFFLCMSYGVPRPESILEPLLFSMTGVPFCTNFEKAVFSFGSILSGATMPSIYLMLSFCAPSIWGLDMPNNPLVANLLLPPARTMLPAPFLILKSRLGVLPRELLTVPEICDRVSSVMVPATYLVFRREACEPIFPVRMAPGIPGVLTMGGRPPKALEL